MKKCYILGAGFSKACELPLASELTSQVFNHLHNKIFHNLNPQLIEDRRKFVRALFPCCDLETKWPDFEDLITLLNEWYDYCRICGGNDSFVTYLKDGLLKHLSIFLCKKTKAANADGKLNIVKRFLKKVQDENGSIISFNWDLLIEVGAQELGIKINYQKQDVNGGIFVSKPHGSLNLRDVQKKYMNNPAINIHSLDTEWEYDCGNKVIVRAQNPSDAPNRIIYPSKSALIIVVLCNLIKDI